MSAWRVTVRTSPKLDEFFAVAAQIMANVVTRFPVGCANPNDDRKDRVNPLHFIANPCVSKIWKVKFI